MTTALFAASAPSAGMTRARRVGRPATAPAVYIGTVAGFRDLPAIDLYNLLVPVGDHPAGSTVSRKTLERHGYHVPPVEAAVA